MSRSLKFQSLENRSLMAADFDLSNGVLSVDGTNGSDVISVSVVADKVVASVNNVSRSFSALDVKGLVVSGLNGNDTISNNTGIVAVINGNNGDDIMKGGTGNDNMFGGNGNDIITDFAGGGGVNLLDGGNGNDSLWGGTGPSDVLLGGNGNDTIYDIVGGPNVMDGGSGTNTLIGRVNDIQISNKKDSVVTFGVGQGPVSLVKGVLYLMGDANNNFTSVSESNGKVNVNYDGQLFTFNKADVKMLAGIAGAGDDVFINDTDINAVYYGTGGNDTLIGGTGKDLLKGGAGNDFLFGMYGNDDLSGDDGMDVIVPGVGNDIVRADLLDVLVGVNKKDTVLGRATYFTAY